MSPTLVWSTSLGLPGQCGTCMHQHSTSGIKRRRRIRIKKVTLHILTHAAMQGCGLTSLMVWTNDKIRDTGKRNVTIRSDIWTTNILSLGFRDIKEWVTLWKLILRSLGCSKIHGNCALSKIVGGLRPFLSVHMVQRLTLKTTNSPEKLNSTEHSTIGHIN